jgi:hypothetical protein
VHGPVGCVELQLFPSIETAVSPVGKVSVTVIAPLVAAVPLFITV